MNDLAQLASPSKSVNCFRFLVKNKIFLGTPAHVVIYPMDRIWKISDFLKDFPLDQFDWKLPASYLNGLGTVSDFAYVELKNNDLPSLKLDTTFSKKPRLVNMVYRMPLDPEAQWKVDATCALSEAVLYPSIAPNLLETVVGKGFSGHSGAAVLDRSSGDCLGIYVRRAAAVPLKQRVMEKTEHLGAFQAAIRCYLGISDIRDHVLRKEDIPELQHDVAVKRGICLPGHQMAALIEAPAVHLRDLEGKEAPDTPSC
eukprot:gene29130-35158_t